MSDSPTACPACGARLADDASVCDLCGHDLALPTDDDLLDEAPLDIALPDPGAPSVAPSAEGGDGLPAAPAPLGPFCTQCGHANPAGARFCAQCGTPLAAARPAAARPARPAAVPAAPVDAPTGQRLWTMVGGATLLVAGLFAVTALNRDDRPAAEVAAAARAADSSGAAAPAGASEGPSEGLAPTGQLATLSPAQTRTIDSLRTAAAALTGEARLAQERALARMQFGFGRPDQAGETMEGVAEASGTADDWRTAGDFLYQWMETLDEEQRQPVAARVVAAYERVLALNADDLDSRTRLGWAAQYAPGDNPMRAIQENQAVLQADSNHVGANYNRAFYLLKIGRFDPAVTQLRKVQRLAGASSAIGRQAEELIAAVEEQKAAAGAGR